MSATARAQVFSAVHSVGALLPADMLVRIAEGRDVSGVRPADYGLPRSRSVTDEAERAWQYLKPLWRDLRSRLPDDAATGRPATDPTGIAATEWLALLWRELGYGLLIPIPPDGLAPDSDPGKGFAVSHRWKHALIHQASWSADLDKRPGGPGTVPPQSMLQECLNRTDAHLWGMLTNGRQLRLLRDSSALATASYVEFDMEAMFDGELFSEFVLLYRLCHVSRLEVEEDASPALCRLEKWRTEAIASGTRALDQLREGVKVAITTLGTGFLRHPDNRELRERLDVGTFHYALQRLVYRLLFLFVAEDREVLLAPSAPAVAKERYARYFSSARLRRHAQRRRGTPHGDLYRALRLVLRALCDDDGCPELALPGLGGIFDDKEADALLHGLSLSNEALLGAVRALSTVRDAGARRNRVVDYRHLGAEELGSIYESLLELVPKYSAAERRFALVEAAGNARKTSGSYYTPSPLIECLLDSALDPVIDDAVKRGEARAVRLGEPEDGPVIERELLRLTVCDPACGSGHFLVAAARRIAKRLAAVREHNPEPTVPAVRGALHEVIAHCIYGVDINPLAVELAKIALWMESQEPGKALGFLDAHIKHGNSLFGATPALLAGGVPDDAFKPLEGDDKKIVAAVKKRNAAERGGQLSFHTEERIWVSNASLAAGMRRIAQAPADSLREVRRQSSKFRDLEESAEYLCARTAADAWCAAFVWPKTQGAPTPVTHGVFHDLQPSSPGDGVGVPGIPASTDREIVRLSEQHRFFHWHLEFPEVFAVQADDRPEAGAGMATGWSGGFSCVVGNPPWERIKLQEQEFFAQRDAAIAGATNAAARKRLIAALETTNPDLLADFRRAKRRAEGESHFLRLGGAFPLTGRGDINTYSVFAETAARNCATDGRFGMVLPTGIATDATTAPYFSDLIRSARLASFLEFENEAFLLSRAVDHRVRFALLTGTGTDAHVGKASFAFGTRHIEDLDSRRFTMPPEEILLVNPNTGTCPLFRSRRDAEITLGIYRRVPVLINENEEDGNPWGVSFMRMFDMANDSHLFRTREELESAGWHLDGNVFTKADARMLPLYEAKMLHHYDHRLGTYEGQTEAQAKMGTLPRVTPEQHDKADLVPLPRYWIPEQDTSAGKVDKSGDDLTEGGVASRLAARKWSSGWLLGWRDICRASDERSMISSLLPATGVGHKFPLAFSPSAALLNAVWSSFVFDYAARQSIGGTSMSYFIVKQLPVPGPAQLSSHVGFLTKRVLELSYTANDMQSFAQDHGDAGPPFHWDPSRREVMRAELDALFFHIYGVTREDTEHILETFPIVRRRDEATYGSYRTKDLILGEYDRMTAAGVGLGDPLVDGDNFASTLTPPPGEGPRHCPG